MKFTLFKYLIIFYTFLTVAFAMGEGYEELTTCLGDSVSDYNVYFDSRSPVTVEPREFRDFDAGLDLIVIECINYLNLTQIVRTRGNDDYLESILSEDEFEHSDGTIDYISQSHLLLFNYK
ncbi:hypothetical protein DFJ63DRAFT_54402 [Scheffersomyces coipomensis]|uniref:uncharacterized protein n=1 Tax=Scheffersomyces coipomensis TaxID=1788519 RepID=UPI00315D6426